MALKITQRLIIPIFLAVFVSFSFFKYKSIYINYYKWKEPYFATPLDLKGEVLELRNDYWGEGYFGAKRNNGRRHRGIDIKADIGTLVYASKSGRAICSYEPTGMGKYIKIKHPDGITTLYGHLSEFLIEPGSRVRQGQPVGLVGKSGNADIRDMQAHLHFEVRNQHNAVNPLDGYLTQ